MSPDLELTPAQWSLPAAIRERLGREAGPQRAMREEGHLLIIMHQIPTPQDRGRRAALFWRHPNGVWQNSLDSGGIESLRAFLESYEQNLIQLDHAEDQAKTAVDYHNVLETLTPILRAARGVSRAMQQARELIKSDRDLINLRDKAADVERSADLLMQDAQFGLNFTAAKQAESQATTAQLMAKTAHRLNLMAAIFFPLTALASVFGMQLKHGLEESSSAFWIVLVAGVLLGAVVSWFITRK